MAMHKLIQQAQQLHIVRDVDLALLDLMYRRGSNTISDNLAWAMLLASRHSAMGHVCVDLGAVLADPLTYFCLPLEDLDGRDLGTVKRAFEAGLQGMIKPLSLSQWIEEISSSDTVTLVDKVDPQRRVDTPFVLDISQSQALFYLTRYWQCEQRLANFISQRSQATQDLPAQAIELLEALFPGPEKSAVTVDWQRVAVALSARSHCAIITGGPGTGKTTTVLRLLALLQALQLAQGLAPLHIKLAAPTGKAATRLNASIANNLQQQTFPSGAQFDGDQLRAAIPTEATTLHRLLGPIANSRRFRQHANNPIAADVVVVDEASMVDLEMMANLVQALDQHTRLILIGDKDQLASVEAGSVLGELCADAGAGHYLPATQTWLQHFTGDHLPKPYLSAQGSSLAQATTMLRVSHRFQQGGSIHALASLVNEGLYQGQPTLLPVQDLHAIVAQETLLAKHKKRTPQLQLFYQPPPVKASMHSWLEPQLAAKLCSGYSTYLHLVQQGPLDQDQDVWAQAVLAAHTSFQLLVALRQGQWGVAGMNATIEHLLQQADLLPQIDTEWYAGRPVMVSRNDYHLKLMNGDMGVCLPYKDDSTGTELLRVAFNAGAEGVRWVLPSRLRAVETVFALTVHKSQGSEFKHTMLMLPAQTNPVLTKELLYTGITRARQCFSLIYGDEQVLEQAMTRQVTRASGLAKRL
ncbi:MAG: exodeoxyribonuclease V subunit alpha [Gammaproteobacteria bacterium]|nr:exodeoxyribonuclease V subunit alpha [Gammaproteobacteria bacterium]